MKKRKSHLVLCILIFSFVCCYPASAQHTSSLGGIQLVNAYDAFGAEKKGLKQDFGFSCLVYHNGKTILFDAGTNSEIFQQNLKALKIKPEEIDIVILSHGHYDHMGGLDYLISVNPHVKIYLPNDFFSLGAPSKFPFNQAESNATKSLSRDELYFSGEKDTDGMIAKPTGRFWKGNVEYLTEAKEVLPGVTLVPTVSELMGTFIKYPPFEKNPRFIGMPELSATFATAKGQVIITGCSHSTIEKIIQEIKKVNGGKVLLVAGGFHLIPYQQDYIEGLAKRMKKDYEIEAVAPAHCSGHLAFSIFKEVYGKQYKFFGLGEVIKL